MGSGSKKSTKKTKWGDYYRSEEEYKAMSWCIKNDITIGLIAAEKYYIYYYEKHRNAVS